MKGGKPSVYERGFPLSYILGKYMSCKNPQLCAKKHEKWKKYQNKFIPIGDNEHNTFLKHYESGTANLGFKTYPDQERPHADLRQFQRAISFQDIQDVVQNGWVIERNYYPDEQVVRLVILGYTKNYRPLHVVCEIVNENDWEIVTVYSPVSKKYKWSNDFQERVCFCKDDFVNDNE